MAPMTCPFLGQHHSARSPRASGASGWVLGCRGHCGQVAGRAAAAGLAAAGRLNPEGDALGPGVVVRLFNDLGNAVVVRPETHPKYEFNPVCAGHALSFHALGQRKAVQIPLEM
jgi:hypothetical protein